MESVEKVSPLVCGHCGRGCGDYAGGRSSVQHVPLCHPNEVGRPDCYRLVTVYHHALRDCRACRILVGP